MKKTTKSGNNKQKSIKSTLRKIRNDRFLYLMLLPLIAWYLIFAYAPMTGLVLAFKDFSYKGGIWGSEWIGLRNFTELFSDKYFIRAIKNTLILGLGRVAFGLPAGVLLAIMLNELRMKRSKKWIQTIVTFPHFISWVVMAGILIKMFSSVGVVNQMLQTLGFGTIAPITNASSFRPFIWITLILKEVGWDSIIYLAAITSIDSGLYESAAIDGAGRFRQIWYITLPGIRSTICVMLILAIGSIITNGCFDQIFNLYTSTVYEVADTLDTYIFRESFSGGMDFGYSTAIGMVKSVIGIIMLLVSNKIVTKAGENGLL